MQHAIGRWIFALGVGLLAAVLAYRWAVDPAPRAERALQERVVVAAREALHETLAIDVLTVVDPLMPERKVGKTYVYRAGEGWEVSGYYRRDEHDLWHPYLATLDGSLRLTHLKVSDPALLGTERGASILEVLP